ncbi:MAG: hypothetical protein WBW16_09025 [Bacteroidota bacterium]
MKSEDIEREVDLTLSMLDSVHRAKATPFFFTRLKARLGARGAKSVADAYLVRVRRSLAVAGFSLLVLLNAYALWRSSIQTTETVREQQATSFAEQYGLKYNRY